MADAMAELAGLYARQRRYAQADTLYRRSLAAHEQLKGRNDRTLVATLDEYAQMLREAGRASEAAALEERARLAKASAATPK